MTCSNSMFWKNNAPIFAPFTPIDLHPPWNWSTIVPKYEVPKYISPTKQREVRHNWKKPVNHKGNTGSTHPQLSVELLSVVLLVTFYIHITASQSGRVIQRYNLPSQNDCINFSENFCLPSPDVLSLEGIFGKLSISWASGDIHLDPLILSGLWGLANFFKEVLE